MMIEAGDSDNNIKEDKVNTNADDTDDNNDEVKDDMTKGRETTMRKRVARVEVFVVTVDGWRNKVWVWGLGWRR